MSEEEREMVQSWETSSAYWDKYRDLIAEMFAPLTEALIEEACIRPGHHVLDIGGGSGEPSLTIARLVRPSGSVMYTDPAAGMLRSAQAEASRRGLTNIQFRQCPADQLPFDDNSFDAAVGRFSAMFFPDPLAGVRETLRVMRERGRIVFAVWAGEEVNPFFTTTLDVVKRMEESAEEEDDNAPDPFRFAEKGKLAEIMREAGAEDIVERVFDFKIEAAISFEQFWQLRTEMSETLRNTLGGLTRQRIEEIKREVAKVAAQYFASGKMSFPARTLMVSGVR